MLFEKLLPRGSGAPSFECAAASVAPSPSWAVGHSTALHPLLGYSVQTSTTTVSLPSPSRNNCKKLRRKKGETKKEEEATPQLEKRKGLSHN